MATLISSTLPERSYVCKVKSSPPASGKVGIAWKHAEEEARPGFHDCPGYRKKSQRTVSFGSKYLAKERFHRMVLYLSHLS